MTDSGSWFVEKNPLWPGQAMTLEVEEKLEDLRSEFQHIQVFRTKSYGLMLVLDGAIQFTERDEFSYQEMMAHVPMLAHPCPRRVLIVGGGDGGVLREVLKHECVERAVLCDIDRSVVEVSKRHFPWMSSSFADPRAEMLHMDGFQYLKDHPADFDVIITDASDPIGPAESLFQREYFGLLKAALRPGGVLCSQAECPWLHMHIISELVAFCRDMFPAVEVGYAAVPTYPCGQLGFIVCAKDPLELRRPSRPVPPAVQATLRYYHADMHAASFVLPQFARKALGGH